MISFWDFKLSGAPPLLSFGVSRLDSKVKILLTRPLNQG